MYLVLDLPKLKTFTYKAQSVLVVAANKHVILDTFTYTCFFYCILRTYVNPIFIWQPWNVDYLCHLTEPLDVSPKHLGTDIVDVFAQPVTHFFTQKPICHEYPKCVDLLI